MTTKEKRETLREKIEAGERRNAERSLGDYAREARDGATSFVKAHPIATVAGGLALGVIVASLVPGPGRRLSCASAAKGSALAAMLTELGIAYGTGLLDNLGDAARDGQDKLEDLGHSVGDTARSLRREADDASESAESFGRDAGKRATRTLRNLRSRMSN